VGIAELDIPELSCRTVFQCATALPFQRRVFLQEISMKNGIAKPSLLAFALALAAGAVHAGECTPSASATVKPQASAAMPAPAQAVYYNPWADLMRMQAVLDSQFNAMNALWMPAMFAPPTAFAPVSAFALPTPVSALQQTRDGYRLEVPLPGFKAEDIHVRLDGQLLAITAQTSSTVKVGRQDGQSRSSFAETLTLPVPVEAAELKQSYENGVLIITLPSRKGAAGQA
jgi:HSP20 family molecular chaperone IbpA